MKQLLLAALNRQLDEHCDVQAGASIALELTQSSTSPRYTQIYSAMHESGFLDLLVPEEQQGAGLTLLEAGEILMLPGYHLCPLPMVEMQLARAWLAHLMLPIPDGSLSIANTVMRNHAEGGHELPSQHQGLIIDQILACDEDGTVRLWDCHQATRLTLDDARSLNASLIWDKNYRGQQLNVPKERAPDLSALNAYALACLMSGASERILAMSLNYVNERVQFGRSIGRFQAIQQQLAEMAQWVGAMRMSVLQAGLSAQIANGQYLSLWIAKSMGAELSGKVADIAHAVHGAIGTTDEYPLHHFSTRLRQWRRLGGGSRYWQTQIGRQLQAEEGGDMLDMMRTITA